MTDAGFAGLRRASRAPQASDDSPGTTETGAEDEEESVKKKDDYMTEEEHNAAVAEASASAKAEGEKAGFDKANARMTKVTSSEHYAGNEKLAADLLAKSGLSADDIIGSLSIASDGKPQQESASQASDEAAEQQARQEMRSNLADSQPGNTASNEGEQQADNSLVASMKARFADRS